MKRDRATLNNLQSARNTTIGISGMRMPPTLEYLANYWPNQQHQHWFTANMMQSMMAMMNAGMSGGINSTSTNSLVTCIVPIQVGLLHTHL